MMVLYVLVAWMALDGVRGGRVDAAGRKRGFLVDEVGGVVCLSASIHWVSIESSLGKSVPQ